MREESNFYYSGFRREPPRSPQVAGGSEIALPKKKTKVTKRVTFIDRLRLKKPKGTCSVKKKVDIEGQTDHEIPKDFSAYLRAALSPTQSASTSDPQAIVTEISANDYIKMVKLEKTTGRTEPDSPAYATIRPLPVSRALVVGKSAPSGNSEIENKHLEKLWNLCSSELKCDEEIKRYETLLSDYEKQIAELKKKKEQEIEKKNSIKKEKEKLLAAKGQRM